VEYYAMSTSTLDSKKFSAYFQALPIINNWRSSHGYPLNTFQVNLRQQARRVDVEPLVAQRTKRLSSIASKLDRFPTMKLSQMQDIGGCRAVVKSVPSVRELVALYSRSRMRHALASLDDYITTPKPSGYRGVHLVYRYHSDKKTTAIYNGLKIEMQLRSKYQHAWATAVETVGTFVRQALKSSLGEEEWLRFFALMGSAIAMRERTEIVPGTPMNRRELVLELNQIAQRLNVESRLQTYGSALQTLTEASARQQSRAHYYLLTLDASEQRLTVAGFPATDLESAALQYLETEKSVADRPDRDAVLVSVDSLEALKRAYPNYFADTRVFLKLLRDVLAPRPLPFPLRILARR
jgi:hypothetical protein